MNLFKNIWLKILALFIAFSFWYISAPHERKEMAENNFSIPVRVINVPSSMVIMGGLPDSILVRARGEKSSIESFQKGMKVFTIDLANNKPGVRTIPILDTQLGIPESLETISITPVIIQINLESRLQKLLPVAPLVTAAPPQGKRWEISVAPDNALVVGPESVIASLNSVTTVSIEPELSEESFQSEVLLTPPHPLVRIIQPERVTVNITVTELTGSKRRR